jgi:ADP-heptose:LPS heptosyltransferase
MKCWPAESFGRLAGMFVGRLGAAVVVFGGPDEVELAQEVLRHAPREGRVVSVAGRLGLGPLTAAARRCDLFVGNDSGPTHLAAAAGVPTLAVFSGIAAAAQWGPLGPHAASIYRAMLCAPCYLSRPGHCLYRRACVRQLHPEAVWEAALRLLLPHWAKLPPGTGPALRASEPAGPAAALDPSPG